MKLPAPAGNAPAEPAMPPMAPEAEAPADDLDFGGETSTETTPEMPEAPADDKPFDKEPFDAGIDVDEESDPKKFIEKLSGKIGQSLRDYTKNQGQPDFELEKFAINSLISATHTAEMDEEDKNDIIKKINKAGKNDSENPDMDDDSNNDDFGNDNGDGGGTDFGGDSQDGMEENALFEEESIFLKQPKKLSIFAPEGSSEFMEENKLNEACWKGYKKDGMKTMFGKKYPNCVKVNENEVIEEGSGNILEETEDYVIYEVIEEGKKKKKKTKKDACYHKVKSRYDVWPSAYASGALVKCRNVGAANWGNSTDESEDLNELSIYEAKKTDFSKEKESGLHGWFSRKGGEGSQGWVDCNTCRDGKCKPCGRKDGEERSKYPSCRPTPGACKTKGKGESWGKKSANESDLTIYENYEGDESNNYMFWLNLKGIHDDAVEILNMDNSKVDALMADGHQWAFEHVVTSKDDIEEVYHFLEGNLEGNDSMMSENMGESNNYMFWSSLKTIAHASGELLQMDETTVDNILSDGHGWALDHIATSNDDIEEVYHFLANTLNAYNGDTEGGYEDEYGNVESVELYEGKYDGKPLGKPMKGDVKKFKVYVKNAKGNVIKVNFGDPNMEIKRDNPKRRKSFRARHKCSQAKDRTTPKYWSCRMWSKKPVSKIVEENNLVSNKKSGIFDKNILKLKLKEAFNPEIMSEPLVEPIVKPTTKPAEPAPSRRNKPFTIEPDTIPQVDPKALTEGKFDYETYHKTLSNALDEVRLYVVKRGFDEIEFNMNDVQHVAYGHTERLHKELTKNGKQLRQSINIQIYRMDSGTYELNMYIA